jgi:hypothetical protein
MKWFQLFEYLQNNVPQSKWGELVEYSQLIGDDLTSVIRKDATLEKFLQQNRSLYLTKASKKARSVYMVELKQLYSPDQQLVLSIKISPFYLSAGTKPLSFSSAKQPNDYRSRYFFPTQHQAESFVMLMKMSLREVKYLNV